MAQLSMPAFSLCRTFSVCPSLLDTPPPPPLIFTHASAPQDSGPSFDRCASGLSLEPDDLLTCPTSCVVNDLVRSTNTGLVYNCSLTAVAGHDHELQYECPGTVFGALGGAISGDSNAIRTVVISSRGRFLNPGELARLVSPHTWPWTRGRDSGFDNSTGGG